MAKISLLSRSSVDKAKGTPDKARDVVKSTYGSAKDAAQSTYASARDAVQGGVNFGVTKTQAALLAGLALAQGLMKYNQKRTRKNLKKARKNLKSAQGTLQDTLQDTLKPRWEATQAALQTGVGVAQDTLTKSAKQAQKQAQKNLKLAQKNLKSVQDTVGVSLAKTQDLLGEGSKRASKGLQQVATSALVAKEAMQEQYVSYQHKRQRARTLFRWGLVVGVVLALLYTPYSGAQVRRRLMEQWEQVRSYISSFSQQ
jgi:uncharacterized membrane-anchored protein YhcB (DUF1043 family)